MEHPAANSEREWILVGMETLLDEARARIEATSSPGKPWASVLHDSVAVTLELLAERPAFARMALIEAPTAGDRAGRLYEHARAFVLAYVDRGADQATEEPEIPATAGRAAVAGAEGLIAGRILNGQTEQLRDLIPDVVYALTVPYLGQAPALRVAQSQGHRRTLRAVA